MTTTSELDGPAAMPVMLDGYRALDLSDERGLLCGRILADMGVDVLRVEPPGGSKARRVGPWRSAAMELDDSLVWQAWAANSRSISLDIACAEGRSLFLRLVERADFVLESLGEDQIERLGLGETTLLAVNPRLVLVSISGFGAFGPWSSYRAPDLVVMAMSGHMALTGPGDGQPLRIGVPQAYENACASAAAAAMIAHTYRVASGKGQRVDVSAQRSIARSLAQAPGEWDLNRVLLRRQGNRHQLPSGVTLPLVWPCHDGYVSFILFGSRGGRSMNELARWMAEEGLYDDVVQGTDWETQDFGQVTAEIVARVQPVFEAFFSRHTRKELGEGGAARGIMLFPLNTTADLLEHPQFHARGFLQPWPGEPKPDSRPVFPGPFIQASETPLSIRRPAPRLGEHNREIYLDEVGLSETELAGLRERGVV